MIKDNLIEFLDSVHRAISYDAQREDESYGPSIYTLEKIEDLLKELSTRVLDLENYNLSTHELSSNSDGVVACKDCRNGKHHADENSVPFCAVPGCNCCCCAG